jgi:hypothetical protein
MNAVSHVKEDRHLGGGASFTLLVLANVVMMAAARTPRRSTRCTCSDGASR